MSEHATSAPLHASLDSDEQTEAFANLDRHVLLMRGLGAALLLAGWAYFTLEHFGSAMFFADTIVFLILGAYAFVAAYTARKETVALEKKLRLSLIMRNMELEGGATRDDLTHCSTEHTSSTAWSESCKQPRGFSALCPWSSWT